jgi:hypothetical protein
MIMNLIQICDLIGKSSSVSISAQNWQIGPGRQKIWIGLIERARREEALLDSGYRFSNTLPIDLTPQK